MFANEINFKTRRCFFTPESAHRWVLVFLVKSTGEIISLNDQQLNRARLIKIITYFLFSVQSRPKLSRRA